MEALARAVNLRGYRTLAFNPLPWKRDAIIDVNNGYITIVAYRHE